MRQIYTKLLLALVFAVSSVAICRAEGPRSTTPADGETIFASDTNPLRSIIIACPYDEPSDYASPLPNGGNATLSKDGTVIQTLPVSQAERSKVMNHYFEVTYNLLEGVYEPGTYTFSVPANTISYEKKGKASNLDAFSISFLILDANSMTVTPANGSVVATTDLREIVLNYSDKVKLQMQSASPLVMTQTYATRVNDLYTYTASVRGQSITFTCTNPDSPTNVPKKGSSYGPPTLTIPAGTFTVDGEPNPELTYSWVLSSFTLKSVTATPPPSVESYSIQEMSEIRLHFEPEMRATANTSTTNNTYVKLEQYVDGNWQRPVGYTSDVFYRIEWDDAHNARLIPRPAASNYTNTFDELETGRYRIHILPYLYDTNSVANADVYLGSYYIEGATEAPIVSQTPPANSAIRATDWEDLVFAFNSEMIPGDSDLEITIKDADGNTVATYTPMDIEWDGDNHSVRIPLNPVIKRGDKEMVYSVFIPRGFVKQSSGAGLPSTEAEFTVTVGKFVIIEGNYPKYVYSPDPKTLTMNTSLNKFVFTYYGADSIELGTELPDIKANGKSMVESCTVTIGRDADDFPTATINFKLLTASTSPNGGSTIPKDGYTYTLDIPALAWTISRGEHVYSTEEHITYKKDAVKNVTSATVQTALINSTCTVKYDDVTTEEMTRAEAVANYSTVKIALSGGKTSQLKAGLGVATLKKASDNSVIATYANPSSYNVSSINYTTTLTEDMFEEGEAYYWELPANAILGYNNKQLSTTLKVNFSIPAAGQAPEARAIRVVNTAGKPRVRLDHIEFECETDNSSYGFAIARNFAVGGPYIADKDGNRLSYIESDEDTGDVEVDIYQFSHPTRKGNMISYKILPIITEQGEYTIVVPEKAFKIDGMDYNSELRHHFEIKDNHVEWSIPVYEQITTRDGIEGCESHPQKGFNRITLTFPEDIDLKLATNQYPVQFNRVWIEGSGNNSYEMAEPVNDVKINVTSEANEVYIDFSPALTTDGNYRLVLPQGAVQMMGAFDEYVPVNSYMAYFTIKDSTTATISPAPGSELTELSKVEFTFTKAAQVLADSNPAAPAGLYDADMNEMEGHKLSVSIEGTKAIISINPPVEADGSYNIIVPAGRFRCKASASAAEEEATEYRISYNVVDPSDATVTPAAGTVAPSMSNFEFEFLKAVDVDLTDQAAAAVHDAAGNVLSQYTVALSMDKDYESDVIVFANVTPSITTSGEYTLVLAANSAACKRTHTSEARNNEEISVPFTVKNPTDSRVTPASGSTRAIAMVADITVVYQNAAKVERGEGTITVLAADGVTPLTEYTATAAVNSDNSGVITITPAITTGGNYRIKVEAGTFICHLDAADEGTPSRERILSYTVQDPTVCTVAPATGSEELEEIKNITFTFANGILPAADNNAKIAVVDAEGNDLTEGVTTTLRVSGSQTRISFEPAIINPGNVKITVPAGTFSAKLNADGITMPMKETVLDYSIRFRGAMTYDNEYESDLDIPTTLDQLFISFPDATNVEIDHDIDDITLDHDTSVKVADAKKARRAITRASEDQNYSVTPVKVDDADNRIKLVITPTIKDEGQTTIHIPAGKFIADGHRSLEAHPVYLVKGDVSTWIDSVIGDDSTVTVVNMNGIVILRDVPAHEVKNLAPGMYIINGRSVMIRR